MKHKRVVQVWMYLGLEGRRKTELCLYHEYKKQATDLDLPDGFSMYNPEEPIDVVLETAEDESLEIQELADEEFGVSV